MNSTLNADYWKNRYKSKDHPWDIGNISPALKSYIDQIENKDIRILIPGCGFAHEAKYLTKQGFNNLSCIDFASEVFEKTTLRELGVNCIVADFFQHTAKYDLILEQTFFCAIEPSLRERYAAQVSNLLAKKGKLVGLLFNMLKTDKPPFGGSQEEYEALFAPYFEFRNFAACYNSVSSRKEFFINFIKKS
jgi:hypothetical protein